MSTQHRPLEKIVNAGHNLCPVMWLPLLGLPAQPEWRRCVALVHRATVPAAAVPPAFATTAARWQGSRMWDLVLTIIGTAIVVFTIRLISVVFVVLVSVVFVILIGIVFVVLVGIVFVVLIGIVFVALVGVVFVILVGVVFVVLIGVVISVFLPVGVHVSLGPFVSAGVVVLVVRPSVFVLMSASGWSSYSLVSLLMMAHLRCCTGRR